MAQEDDLPIGKSMEDFTAEVGGTAYFLWEQAGRPRGREDDFWYKALDQHIRARANVEKLSQGPPPDLPSA
ncbi:DUF2934 domain-containing protein [Devosia naphthalenivorans]|uniref:DUF2934 domain-containing protein n=1 Tax=Devosia naphthalenivorans TaxID=2082392 RepID=UPI001FEC6B52|nr:DUF2934 domain-containing protein [Devosia naphthalenivorans]